MESQASVVLDAQVSIGNGTRDRTIATRAVIADSLWARFRGLMLKSEDKFRPGDALIIDPCSSIHMFFMRFPIDVLYVSRENKVVRIQESIKPWRIGPIHTPGARYVVELPAGTVKATGTQVGDVLSIE